MKQEHRPHFEKLIKVIHIGELFFPNFDIFFAHFFNLPYFPGFFLQMFDLIMRLIFFCFWRISRIVTERLRLLIHTRYIQLFPNFENYGKNALR